MELGYSNIRYPPIDTFVAVLIVNKVGVSVCVILFVGVNTNDSLLVVALFCTVPY